MASKAEKFYPPYEGEEPYIHLCFSDRDERKVRPLLRRLLLRGCRVWYSMGEARDRSTLTGRNQRMLGAGITVLYLTEAARQDTELKNKLLVCQRMHDSLESPDTIVTALIARYGAGKDVVSKYAENIKGVTADKVRQMAVALIRGGRVEYLVP